MWKWWENEEAINVKRIILHHYSDNLVPPLGENNKIGMSEFVESERGYLEKLLRRILFNDLANREWMWIKIELDWG